MQKAEQKNIKEVTKILQKLAHPLRLELVLKLLDNKCCVKKIGEDFNLPQASASQHLKQLRESNIVEDNRKGNSVEYCLKDPWIIDFLMYLKSKVK